MLVRRRSRSWTYGARAATMESEGRRQVMARAGTRAGASAGGSADDAPQHLEAGMTQNRERALHPEDIARLFVARVNSGDLEGILELFEPDAVVAYPVDRPSQGTAALREL